MLRLYIIGVLILPFLTINGQVYQGLQVPFNLGRFGNVSPITQASGLAIDPNGVSLWTHNDQGNPSTSLYKFLPATGNQMITIQKEVNILNVTNFDWEDLAKDDLDNIYVCQIGKNCNANSDPEECPNRFVYKIHKVPIAALNHLDSNSVTPQTYYFRYPLTGYDLNNCQPDDTVFVNSEAAIWFDGALYVFTKNIWSKTTNNCGGWINGYTYMFKITLTEGSTLENPIVATYHGKVNLKINPNDIAAKYQVTAAAISPDSTTLAMTTYGRLWLFRHFAGDSFFNGTDMYVDYSGTGSDTITRGYEGIEFKNNDYLYLCVDGVNGRISGVQEDSITQWVRHDGDSGPGSLRHAALCAGDGDTIFLKQDLVHDTIHLSTGPVTFNADARILQGSEEQITIESASSAVIDIQAERSIILKNLYLSCGANASSALINHGQLSLFDVTIHQWDTSHLAITNMGLLQIGGNCKIE